MLKEERYDKILEILEKENYCTAQRLSSMLYVSLPTMRRDLAEMHRRNLIIRSHGGAGKLNFDRTVSPINYRKTVKLNEKKRICKYASKLIRDNSFIFADASTTVYHIVDYIPASKGVTLITNSIPLTVYAAKKGLKVYTTGGEFQESSVCYAGSYAVEFVNNFTFDAAFFSSRGVDENNNICDTSELETSLRKAVLSRSRTKVFMCDTSKMGVNAPYVLASLYDMDYVVTEETEETEKESL